MRKSVSGVFYKSGQTETSLQKGRALHGMIAQHIQDRITLCIVFHFPAGN